MTCYYSVSEPVVCLMGFTVVAVKEWPLQAFRTVYNEQGLTVPSFTFCKRNIVQSLF